jgi:phosphoglucosamine mutase
MINVPVSAHARQQFGTSEIVNRAVREIEEELNGQGRVILRPSGTESLIRVTLEGADSTLVERLANQLAETVRAEFGG